MTKVVVTPNDTLCLAEIIDQAFAAHEPYRTPWPLVAHVSYQGEPDLAVWNEVGEFDGIDWYAVRRLPDSMYLMSEWSDSSGPCPRFIGHQTQWIVVRDGQFRLLHCYQAGGVWQASGRGHHVSDPIGADRWEVIKCHPYACRERSTDVDGPVPW